MEPELPIFKRSVHRIDEMMTVKCRIVHVLPEEAEASPPALLGVIHRDIGLLQQGVEVGAIDRSHGNADGDRGIDLLPLDVENRGHAVENLVGDGGRGNGAVNVAKQDDEFVATLSADRIGFAQAFLETLDDGNQQFVTDTVAERVIDALELVQVEEHEGHRLAGSLALLDGLAKAVA